MRGFRWSGVAAGLLSLACGSKSGLLADSSASGGAAGFGGSSGSGGSGGVGGRLDAGPDAPPLPDCIYAPHGDPLELFSHPDGLHTPRMMVLDAGGGGAARIAYAAIHEHFWHPEIRVAEVQIGQEFPEGVDVLRPMKLYGIDAHAPGQLSRTASGPGLVMAYYHADEASPNVVPGVKFRPFDTATWSPGAEVFIEEKASYAYSVAPGPGMDGSDAYLVAWRSPVVESQNFVEPRLALLNGQGKFLRGPLTFAPVAEYPGVGAATLHDGSHYVVIDNSGDCEAPGPCKPGIAVSRFEAGTSKASVTRTADVAVAELGLRPLTPTASTFAGTSVVVWRERSDQDDEAPPLMRVARFDANGQLSAPPWTEAAPSVSGPVVHASDQGALVLWGEAGDPGLPQDQVGYAKLVAIQFGKTGELLQRFELSTTDLAFSGPYHVTTLSQPESLLVTWTARAPGASETRAYLARFDCQRGDR